MRVYVHILKLIYITLTVFETKECFNVTFLFLLYNQISDVVKCMFDCVVTLSCENKNWSVIVDPSTLAYFGDLLEGQGHKGH